MSKILTLCYVGCVGVMLVKVIKSQTSMRQEYFLNVNHLRFNRIKQGRYAVLQKSKAFDGSDVWDSIGYTFCEGAYHIFVPSCRRSPAYWYFGITRCDAISGYLESLKSSAPAADDKK